MLADISPLPGLGGSSFSCLVRSKAISRQSLCDARRVANGSSLSPATMCRRRSCRRAIAKLASMLALNLSVSIPMVAFVKSPAYFKKSGIKLGRQQRALARRQSGSKNRSEAKVLVAKTYERTSNQRRNFLHKVANAYIKDYGTIMVLDLKIANMVQNHNFHLSKSISDASWGKFFELLSYKAKEAGRSWSK